MVLIESIYKEIEISPKKPITKSEIAKLLNIARRTRSYVKFTVSNGRFYIMVTFHRNGKINIQSNIRQNQAFQRTLFWLEQRGYSEGVWAYNIEMWINKFAKQNLR